MTGEGGKVSALVAALCCVVGCSFDTSGVGPQGRSRVDGRTEALAWRDLRASDTALPDVPLPRDLAPDRSADGRPPPLVDRGLIVRYFIDEAAEGTAPTQLEDAAPAPLPLAVTYGDSGSFAEVAGNRGLRWTAITEDGRAAVPVWGSKIRQALDGATAGTIEVVVDIQGIVSGGTRISHLGAGSDAGWFTLRTERIDRVDFYCRDRRAGEWNVPLATAGRIVLQLVFDSAHIDAEARAMLYVDGVLQARGGGNPPEENAALSIDDDGHHVLGNREIGDRGLSGTLFYAALYSVALSPGEAAANASRLLAADDAR